MLDRAKYPAITSSVCIIMAVYSCLSTSSMEFAHSLIHSFIYPSTIQLLYPSIRPSYTQPPIHPYIRRSISANIHPSIPQLIKTATIAYFHPNIHSSIHPSIYSDIVPPADSPVYIHPSIRPSTILRYYPEINPHLHTSSTHTLIHRITHPSTSTCPTINPHIIPSIHSPNRPYLFRPPIHPLENPSIGQANHHPPIHPPTHSSMHTYFYLPIHVFIH